MAHEEDGLLANFTRADVVLRGIAPLTQSKFHEMPKLKGESAGDYDTRTWRGHLHVKETNGVETVVIPAFGVHLCLMNGAKYSKLKIVGAGNATWSAKFKAGIAIHEAAVLDVFADEVKGVAILVNADGVRGSGKRVLRHFPTIPAGWKASFTAVILDEAITKDVFAEMLKQAGLFVGLGQFRPENGGSNGRFIAESIEWHDHRELLPRRQRESEPEPQQPRRRRAMADA